MVIHAIPGGVLKLAFSKQPSVVLFDVRYHPVLLSLEAAEGTAGHFLGTSAPDREPYSLLRDPMHPFSLLLRVLG